MKVLYYIILLLLCCHVCYSKHNNTMGRRNSLIRFKQLVNSFNKTIHNKSFKQPDLVGMEINIRLYLQDVCIANRYREKKCFIKKNGYIYSTETRHFILTCSDCLIHDTDNDNEKLKFKNLVSIFKEVITTPTLKQPRRSIIKADILGYFKNICIINFYYSNAYKSCSIKHYRYHINACEFVLICRHLDQNYQKHIKTIKTKVMLKNLQKIDYCNNAISVKCHNICFNPSDCKNTNELDVPNKCDTKAYYTCVKFNGIFIPELHFCNNYFNGIMCV